MEKFKIRFWDKERKEMIYEGGRPVVFDTSEALIGTEVNGVLVYDGDYMESTDDDGNISQIPIVFENGSFWADESFAKDGSYLTLLAEWKEPILVKGNIYEKP